MSAGDLLRLEHVGTVVCPSCGQLADIIQIGRFVRRVCQFCGGNYEAAQRYIEGDSVKVNPAKESA